MFALINEVRHYAWGSHTAMAEFLGSPSPSAEPEAELWIGAYPARPSRLPDGRTLRQLIEDNPLSTLGAASVAHFGPRLPFLVKVLTIGAPLSLQVHPNATQAQAGFAAEEAADVALDDPSRNYRDQRHKPEMLCALTEVEVFCGFRAGSAALALLDELAVSELRGLRAALSADGLSAAVGWVFAVAGDDVAGVVHAVAKSAATVTSGPYADALNWIARLAEEYPRDHGVILLLLCDFIRLEPGHAVVIPAGCLHAYLCGVGVEVMAESDNVLRGGLTTKHVDVVELQRVLDVRGPGPRVLRGEVDAGGGIRFASGVDEFTLTRYEITEAVVLDGNRPSIILTVEGAADLRSPDGTRLQLPRGRAAFVAAAERDVAISGPAVVFEATVGLPA